MVLIALSTWYVAVAYPVIIGLVAAIQRIYLRTSRQMRPRVLSILNFSKQSKAWRPFELLVGKERAKKK